MTVLTQLDLNRALLARQLLLERAPVTPVAALQRVFAMQAQLPRPPVQALWSRVAGFRREDYVAALLKREILRTTSLRGTLHVSATPDTMQFRSTLQPVLDKGLHAILKNRGELPEKDLLVAAARERFAASPCTFEDVRDLLQARHPDADERAMGYLVRMTLPLVQVPTESPWGFPGSSDFTTVEAWVGEPPDAEAHLDDLARRYLAAFGPATPGDMQVWSGLSGLKATFERLRPALVTFKDGRKRELFDLPDAPRPDGATPAPVRFLPDFDAAIMGHDDRTRILADEHRKEVFKANLRVLPTFLVDGRVAGTWRLDRKGKRAIMAVTPFEPPSKAVRDAVLAEAEALARFSEPDAGTWDVKSDEN